MKWLKKFIPDGLAVLGSVCITVGGFLIADFVGWIVLGALLVAGAVIFSKAGGGGL